MEITEIKDPAGLCLVELYLISSVGLVEVKGEDEDLCDVYLCVVDGGNLLSLVTLLASLVASGSKSVKSVQGSGRTLGVTRVLSGILGVALQILLAKITINVTGSLDIEQPAMIIYYRVVGSRNKETQHLLIIHFTYVSDAWSHQK